MLREAEFSLARYERTMRIVSLLPSATEIICALGLDIFISWKMVIWIRLTRYRVFILIEIFYVLFHGYPVYLTLIKYHKFI